MLHSLRFNVRLLVLIPWISVERGTLMWYALVDGSFPLWFFFCKLRCFYTFVWVSIHPVNLMQRHDIFKRRLDSSGNVIEAKQDGIGHTKVSFFKTLNFFVFICHLWSHCKKSLEIEGLKFCIILFFRISDSDSLFLFLSPDWKTFTETWWKVGAQWNILRFLFWSRSGKLP